MLRDDILIYQDDKVIVTKWNVFRPKAKFSHGVSCYFLEDGYKVSKFLNDQEELVYYYCDIIDTTYDAQENPIPVIYNNNLYEVQEYLSITNHIYSGMCFTIAESSWNKLSADQQQIVSDAAKASADYDRELNEQQTNDLVSALEEKGMKINSPELAPFAAATEKVLTDNADTYGDLLDQLKAWKEAR